MFDTIARYKYLYGGLLLGVLVIFAFFAGMCVIRPAKSVDAPTYSSGMYGKDFFDAVYDRAQTTLPLEEGERDGAPASALVAHHLLVADKIAEVFDVIGNDDLRTVVLVSPNHFSRGIASVQVSEGAWETPYGTVYADIPAVEKVLHASSLVRHDETAYSGEHGIYGLTPFIARSFPRARIVPIILREDVRAEDAWRLGEVIATELPHAVLVASVDMTHYHDADYTAANDAKVLATLAAGVNYAEHLDIDSNASLRVLMGFNHVRGTFVWHMTHHGSSLGMGATADWHENTSHILGYFTSSSFRR